MNFTIRRGALWLVLVSALVGPPALLSVPAWGELSPDAAYRAAAGEYRRTERSQDSWTSAQWDGLISRFERIGAQHPTSEAAPKAFYMAGKLSFHRARRSSRADDYKRARRAFAQLTTKYPQHALADDAQYYLGEIALRLGDKQTARREFTAVLTRFPKGDMVRDAKQRLAHLPSYAPAGVAPHGVSGPTPADAATTASETATITRVWSLSAEGYTRVVIYLSAMATPNKPVFLPASLGGNARLYVDIPGTRIGASVERTYPINDAFLKQARIGNHAPGVARVVLDVASIDTARTKVFAQPGEGGAYKIVLDVFGKRDAAPHASGASAASPAQGASEPSQAAESDDVTDAEILKIVEDLVKSAPPDSDAPIPSAATAPAEAPPAATSSTSPTARPKRLVRTIVVDAGHGGDDPGAIGHRGLKEKDITLRLAKKLKARLYTRLGVRVVLTRTVDKSLPLEERTALANAAVRNEETDLFISLHANAATNTKAYGIETYFLNNTTDRAALRLASFENGDRGAKPVFTSPDDFMFADLTQNYKAEVSGKLAGYIQESMVRNLSKRYARSSVKDLGVKHAVFFVLMGARVPSVLIETGFITNSAESKRLNDNRYLDTLADAITTGVANYIQSTQRTGATPL